MATGPALFSGDACSTPAPAAVRNGGNVDCLVRHLAACSPTAADTRVCQTTVTSSNLSSRSRAGHRQCRRQALLPAVTACDPAASIVTAGQEKQFNTFFRLQKRDCHRTFYWRFPDLPAAPDADGVHQTAGVAQSLLGYGQGRGIIWRSSTSGDGAAERCCLMGYSHR
jgi:hypothetical protein